MKDEACGSEVWGFGSGVVGRVETPALPVLAMAEWLHGARGSLMALSLPIDMTKTWNTDEDMEYRDRQHRLSLYVSSYARPKMPRMEQGTEFSGLPAWAGSSAARC